MAGNPRWAASGAGKVFQTLGQCRGELRRRDLVVGATEDAEERCAQAAVTLWAVNLDEKAAGEVICAAFALIFQYFQ